MASILASTKNSGLTSALSYELTESKHAASFKESSVSFPEQFFNSHRQKRAANEGTEPSKFI